MVRNLLSILNSRLSVMYNAPMNRRYARMLRDPKWVRKSLKLRKSRGKCDRCGRSDRLSCHHGYYREKLKPWQYPEASIWVLCPDCHRTMDQFRRAAVKALGHVHPSNAEKVLSFLGGQR